VYEGAPDVMRGKARYLRVLHIEPKTYTYWYKRPYISTGPVVSAVQSEGVKRILGTVPIEEDGSVAFNAPPGLALHFQLLDDQYRALQTMRSFTGVMPGERRGCTGCHESHSRVPEYQGATLAMVRQPSDITPPPWGDESLACLNARVLSPYGWSPDSRRLASPDSEKNKQSCFFLIRLALESLRYADL
jgi:hypothetical protein